MAVDRATRIRAVKLARHPNVRIADVRARFGVGESALRRAKKELAAEARWSEDDLVLAALHGAERGLAPSAIVEFVDWVEHVRWTEAEVTARLESLRARGAVAQVDSLWRLAAPWP